MAVCAQSIYFTMLKIVLMVYYISGSIFTPLFTGVAAGGGSMQSVPERRDQGRAAEDRPSGVRGQPPRPDI